MGDASPLWGKWGQTTILGIPPTSIRLESERKKNYGIVATDKGLRWLFSWDSAKSETHLRQQGVRFEVAQWVFDNPLHITRQDRIAGGELRWQTLSMAGGVALLLVAPTWRETASGQEHLRIISARRATRLERKIYERGP